MISVFYADATDTLQHNPTVLLHPGPLVKSNGIYTSSEQLAVQEPFAIKYYNIL